MQMLLEKTRMKKRAGLNMLSQLHTFPYNGHGALSTNHISRK